MQSLAAYYVELKHLHTTLIAISVLFFITRLVWNLRAMPIGQQKWARISPHVIDTFLLLSGFALAMALGFTPGNSPWLAEKLIAIVAYIALAVIAMKSQRGAGFKIFAGVGAIAWVLYASHLAMTKQALLLG
ncbi:SirB2 family protein [Paraferrimonas sedimenticola]|uniref:SirB family protein n=1 Tax=Paraferrimonas sedimenticola TaxID=375674 RepID=A0AA37RVM9_9GAMM|nr:SirB2 family protein [Paraferrimonas sedimenticola]GLP95452.1 SirB family protein [Paraferrimonas sedimenticola]